MEKKLFSPREFLRGRRPEMFSDSVPSDIPVLDRSMLEYHLDSLTSRGQETAFEKFARHLAQREICPNLLPQTGPTGGGDSKVDSETYPVADDLSLFWHVGIGRDAGAERWAFAFSAKKDWPPKLRSDIKKIASTNRGYSKAFFVTNQYVPDKKRAAEEDKLHKQHQLDVRILDRSWILDRVFEGKHERIAIEDLMIQTSVRPQILKGPLDLWREQALDEVEERIKVANQDDRCGVQVVADCIEAAILARSLDRPRTEIEGDFARADRAAKRYGTSHQRLFCAYQKAWTTFWWYEDYHAFSLLYDETESHAKGSRNTYDLELLTNLWHLLYPQAISGDLDPIEAKLDKRTATLTAELDRLSAEDECPSNALQARTLRLLMNLVMTVPNDADAIFNDLQEVVRQCEGLVGYPFEPLAEILAELGQLFGNAPAYDNLFNAIVKITAERKGEVSAARMLTKRGAQQLSNDRPYEAIRLLGRALTRLYKNESRNDLIRALHICSGAYERVGLFWAARGTLLIAASLATSDFHEWSDLTALQAACYNRMKWLELQLGRIAHVLTWHEIDQIITAALRNTPDHPEWLGYDRTDFDALLGMLLLKSEFKQLRHLSGLPDVLAGLDLPYSSVALLFALGHEDKVPEGFLSVDCADLQDFFVKWCAQPAGKELPRAPELGEDARITLNARVLGCEFVVECPNASPYVELAESILAALESLMATGMVDRLIGREPAVIIRIEEASDNEEYFESVVRDDSGTPCIEITCTAFDPNSLSLEAQSVIKDKLLELMANLLPRAFFLGHDPEWTLLRLFRDDLALERSLGFTGSFIVMGNVLGHSPRTSIDAWCADAVSYKVKRSEVWNVSLTPKEDSPKRSVKPVTFAEGPLPHELRDPGRLRHTDVRTISLIREALWNQAGWNGTAFFLHPDFSVPPILALLFKNGDVAGEIFTHWRDELGTCDERESLRVSIVRGISKCAPHSYRVVMGINPSAHISGADSKLAFLVSRIQTMEPSSDVNLRNFLERYNRLRKYQVGYAFFHGPAMYPELAADRLIEKRELCVRDAWEIGKNDIDCVAIQPEDDPVVPPDQTKVPVMDLLKKMARR